MYYSYVMGIDENIYKLEKEGFVIEKDNDNYQVSFPAMMNEGSFRNYPDDSTYNYAMPLYKSSLEKIKTTSSEL